MGGGLPAPNTELLLQASSISVLLLPLPAIYLRITLLRGIARPALLPPGAGLACSTL